MNRTLRFKWGRWDSLKKTVYAATHCRYCHQLMMYRPWLFPRRLWAVINQDKVVICPYCRKRRVKLKRAMALATAGAVSGSLAAMLTRGAQSNKYEDVRKLLKDEGIID